MAKYPLYIKDITYAKLIMYAGLHGLSLGKFLNVLLDNIANELNPQGQYIQEQQTPVFLKENLDKICHEAHEQQPKPKPTHKPKSISWNQHLKNLKTKADSPQYSL